LEGWEATPLPLWGGNLEEEGQLGVGEYYWRREFGVRGVNIIKLILFIIKI